MPNNDNEPIDWSYTHMLPKETVDNFGRVEALRMMHLNALVLAQDEGVNANRLGEPVEVTMTSWVLEDGEYIPHVADGTETYYGFRLRYSITPA